jgi:hypothetical protein
LWTPVFFGLYPLMGTASLWLVLAASLNWWAALHN